MKTLKDTKAFVLIWNYSELTYFAEQGSDWEKLCAEHVIGLLTHKQLCWVPESSQLCLHEGNSIKRLFTLLTETYPSLTYIL
jgi:hypothetical protein